MLKTYVVEWVRPDNTREDLEFFNKRDALIQFRLAVNDGAIDAQVTEFTEAEWGNDQDVIALHPPFEDD